MGKREISPVRNILFRIKYCIETDIHFSLNTENSMSKAHHANRLKKKI